jgi:hypothetical protein
MIVDTTKLMTPANYAKLVGVQRNAVYNWIKLKLVKSVVIDGVKFVVYE